MSLHSRILLSLALAFVVTVGSGCGGGNTSSPSIGGAPAAGDPSVAPAVQAAISADWAAYRSAHNLPDGGGLNVYLEGPSGTCFASAGMPAGTDQHTHFRIASNTKSFTAAAVMLLAQQGRLRLDDTIDSTVPGRTIPYVPDTPQFAIPYKNAITIRQLLNHTAGVYDVTNKAIPASCPVAYAGQSYIQYVENTPGQADHQFSPAEFVGVVATCAISTSAPGAEYHYSNTGYSLLAVIIEQVSGVPYDQFIRQNLLVPNALSDTSIVILSTDRTLPAPFSSGYVFADGQLMDATQDNMSANIAEGNIISTPADLARWIRRLVQGEAGPSRASVTQMEAPCPQSGSALYGLGIGYFNGLGYGHTGAHQGYLSLMTYDPTHHVAMVLYFNIWDYANLTTDQYALLLKAGRDAQAAAGY